MRLTVSHLTEYHYREPVAYGLQQLRLTPKNRAGQIVHSWNTEIIGGTEQLAYSDHHNNQVQLIALNSGTTHLEIRCGGEVETENNDGIIGKAGNQIPLWLYLRQTNLTQAGPTLRRFARTHALDGSVGSMHDLMKATLAEVRYDTDVTHAQTTAEQAMELGGGVCQDHAHMFISLCRLQNIPARYVSGYLMMTDRVDQVATHAWAEAYLPDIGWVGFDVSNGISPDEKYVRVATGLDYADAAPIRGLRYGAPIGNETGAEDEKLIVSIRVEQ